MKTTLQGEKLFYYTPLTRFKYVLAGAVLSFVAAFFMYLASKYAFLNMQNASLILYLLPFFLCVEYTCAMFIRRGINGVYLKIGGNYVQINSARYFSDEIQGFCSVGKGEWTMVVTEEAFSRQPRLARYAHKYGLLTYAAGLTAGLCAAFLYGGGPSIIKLIWLIIVDIILIINAVLLWRNYTAYMISNISEKEKPALAAEIEDFCRYHDLVLTAVEDESRV